MAHPVKSNNGDASMTLPKLLDFTKRVSYRINVTAILMALVIAGCGKTVNADAFVGKWKSSKLATPLYLYANGEWEIKTDEGVILQYGVWRYEDKKIIWSYKLDSEFGHDANPVLSVKQAAFELRESDNSVTTFYKLGTSN